MRLRLSCLSLFFLWASLLLHAQTDPTWTTAVAPFQIADNLYYVGSQDLASYLVTTPKGNILINANLASSPPQIRASVEKLGFRWADTRILLNSQAHSDHMLGAAEVIRETHASNMVMDGDVSVVETGGRTDFLAPSTERPLLPRGAGRPRPARRRRCQPGRRHLDRAQDRRPHPADAPHGACARTYPVNRRERRAYRHRRRNQLLVGIPLRRDARHPVSYPGIAQDFEHTFALLLGLPCDVFLGAHGQYFNMLAKLKRYPQEGPSVFIDPAGYRRFVENARATFRQALAKQQAAAVHRAEGKDRKPATYAGDGLSAVDC